LAPAILKDVRTAQFLVSWPLGIQATQRTADENGVDSVRGRSDGLRGEF